MEQPIPFAPPGELTHRHYALLRAVEAGRCELSCSCEPALFIDGRSCCDQMATRVLTSAGLIGHAGTGPVGHRVPARLTAAGRAVLGQQARPSLPAAA